MTGSHSDQTMTDVLANGAGGYIRKDLPALELIGALRDALNGGVSLSAASVKRLVDIHVRRPKTRSSGIPDDLSKSERKVFDLLCQGLSNRRIAELLNYSESTIRKRVSAILAKSQTDSRLELVVKCTAALPENDPPFDSSAL